MKFGGTMSDSGTQGKLLIRTLNFKTWYRGVVKMLQTNIQTSGLTKEMKTEDPITAGRLVRRGIDILTIG